MSNLPIQFIDKENSPALLAFMQQFGEQSYVDAELINKFRDAINEIHSSLNPDRIISLGTETISGNQRTYEGYKWQINGVEINNIGNPIQLIFPSATTGFKRNDISVFKADGTIERIAGIETDGEIVSPPDVPEGTLYFKTYSIDGNVVESEPEPPIIDGSIYKKKIENTRYKSRLSGENVIIPFQAAGQSHYSVTRAALVSVAGFTTAGLTTPMYEGQDVIFENQTGHDITLKDSFGVDTSFVIGADLIVPNEGKIWFRFRNNELELIMKSWVNVDLSTKQDKLTETNFGQFMDVDLATKLTPSVNDTFVGRDSLTNEAVEFSMVYIQPKLTNPITGTGANGQVAFFNGINTQTGDNGLFWDNTNKRLGIATNSPQARLDVIAQGVLETDITFRVRNSTNTRDFLVVNGAGDVYNNGVGGGETNTHFGVNTARNRTGSYNSTFGNKAGRDLTTGTSNALFGFNAGRNITTQNGNTFIGTRAGESNIGNNNTVVGTNALLLNTTGFSNIAIGAEALYSTTTAFFNTALGNEAGFNNTTGGRNIFLGALSGRSNTTGQSNICIGINSAFAQTTGNDNIFVGDGSGIFLADGVANLTISNNSLFLGRDTRANADNQTNQIVIGDSAIGNGSNSVTIGNDSITKTILKGNIGIGTTTPGARLDVRAQGALATDIVFRVRNSTNTKNFLVVNGAGDVYNNGAGGINTNTFFGENVGRNTIGGNNTAIGVNALYSNTTASANTAIGVNALQSNTTGGSNTAIGTNAGRLISTGAHNTLTVKSIFIGVDTKALANNETNQIVIGDSAIGLGSNSVVLGNTSITRTQLRGQVIMGAFASAPTGIEGAIYYNSTDKKHYGFNGTTWNALY